VSPARMSRFEAAVRVVLELGEAFNRHDVSGMLELLGSDCTFESWDLSAGNEALAGTEQISAYLQHYFQGSPQAKMTVEDVFSTGTRCVLLWKIATDGTGELQAALRGVDIYRVRSGLIGEKLTYFHRAGLLQR
jgi:ketosteroid isomerase-like protein